MDENLKDKILKLGINKRNGKLDITWEQLANRYSTYFKTGEDLRCWVKRQLKKADKLPNKSEHIDKSAQNKLNKMDLKIIELRKEKIKYQDQKRELRKLEREWGRAEHFYDEIKETINNIKPLRQMEVNSKYCTEDINKEGLLLLSDFHVGLFCDNYWNEFNKDILYKRVNKLLNKVIEYGKLNKINKLHIFSLGDLINGFIHITARITNTENVIQQTQLGAELLSNFLLKLSENFPEIYFYNTVGNHDRLTPNKQESLIDENFMFLIPWYLKARLKNINNIKFVDNKIDNGIIVAKICGKYVFGVHGDRDRVKDVVPNLTLMLKIIPSMVCLGHTHHHEENEFDNIDVVVNSSLSGVDNYAKDIRKISKPSQKLIIFTDKDWRECTYNINLENI